MNCCNKPMKITNCRYSNKTKVLSGIMAKYRRRECDVCGNKTSTFEIGESDIERIRTQAVNDFKIELSRVLTPQPKESE